MALGDVGVELSTSIKKEHCVVDLGRPYKGLLGPRRRGGRRRTQRRMIVDRSADVGRAMKGVPWTKELLSGRSTSGDWLSWFKLERLHN